MASIPPVEVTPQPGFTPSPVVQIRGQNSVYYPDRRLSPENAEILSNVNITERGAAVRRFGYSKYNSSQITESATAKAIVGLAQAKFKNGTTVNIEVAGSKIYTDDGTTRTDIIGTLTINADSQNSHVKFAFIKNQLLGTNDSDETWTYSGSGNATALATVPWTTCRDLLVHKNMVVAMRTTEVEGGSAVVHPTRLRWPDVVQGSLGIDVNTWPADNKYEVQEDGADILGGVNVGSGQNSLLGVVKTDGLHLVSFAMQAGFIEATPERELTGSFNPVSRMGILHNPNFGTWIIAEDGAYIVRPDFSFELVTAGIQSEWNDLNEARLPNAVSFIRRKDHQVRTLVSSEGHATGHDRVLVYDWETGDVWFDTPADTINYATTWVTSNIEYDMFGSSDGYVYQGNDKKEIKDDGTDINWKITMSPNDLGTPNLDKTIHSVLTHFITKSGSQTIEFTAFLNEGRLASRSENLFIGAAVTWNSGVKWDEGNTWGGEATDITRAFVNRTAQTVSPQWQGTEEFELKGYQIIYTPAE